MIREYKTIREICGPLMVVDHVQDVTYDELAEIVLSDGSTRRCKVLEVNGDRAVVQLFEASAGINLADSRIRFLGHPLQLAVSRDMLGRVFNGMGQPIDGGAEIIADEHRDIIRQTAVIDDDLQGADPVQVGAGKFDAYAGLKEVLRRPLPQLLCQRAPRRRHPQQRAAGVSGRRRAGLRHR